ncbi:hypothetical protein [Tardiphaga sp.]|uniref:hypothetical protein n=1 Tax=Tardiphaga sp. TaxID=1926292 RepID=UPI00262873C1|nr:hypothetical protein [Tardiphaga sp.]
MAATAGKGIKDETFMPLTIAQQQFIDELLLAGRPLGKPDDGINGDHLMECPVCGVVFDMHDLDAALGEHMHDGPEMPTIICPVPDLEG